MCHYISFQNDDLSICDIADGVSKDPDFDLQDQLDDEEIIQLLHSIGSFEFKQEDFNVKSVRLLERSLSDMKKAIYDYVKKNCGCVL